MDKTNNIQDSFDKCNKECTEALQFYHKACSSVIKDEDPQEKISCHILAIEMATKCYDRCNNEKNKN